MFGQPKNYSDMLERIFISSLIVGISCSVVLGIMSPTIQDFFNNFSFTLKWKIGENVLPILLFLIPSIVAILARICKLHNLISTILRIRENFDVKHILLPMVKGVNIEIDSNVQNILKKNRYTLMRDVFYKYAPDVDKAIINSQFVATALDQWSWFWSFVEPTVILLITAAIAYFIISWQSSLVFLGVLLLFILIATLIYPSCIKAAQIEVDDILNNNERKATVLGVFQNAL
jgi:hypothetical protein